jgi:hypothetical protein
MKVVRGYYSDLRLDPTLQHNHSMYPSHDHTTFPRDHKAMFVEARVVNDMRSHTSEGEFRQFVEHFYAVGLAKGKIPQGVPQRLPDGWSTVRHFGEV